eukprot:TRINITY_DN3160_c3_g1_i4.p1 TRINITY_DN3160_c3_g1~~TRINITY_DN3160_c3_g1_i4.p1  ORF type:complete len:197 (-),score=21.49 TRINITY_DN3160_c3_g1_i4:91-681(-)
MGNLCFSDSVDEDITQKLLNHDEPMSLDHNDDHWLHINSTTLERIEVKLLKTRAPAIEKSGVHKLMELMLSIERICKQMQINSRVDDREAIRERYITLAKTIERLTLDIDNKIQTRELAALYTEILTAYENLIEEALSEWINTCLKYKSIRDPNVKITDIEDIFKEHKYPLWDWSLIEQGEDDIYKYLFEDPVIYE